MNRCSLIRKLIWIDERFFVRYARLEIRYYFGGILLFEVTSVHIIIRLLLATLIAGIIGSDREYKNRPAGMRTHILVCIGACVIAMIQQEIAAQNVQFALAHSAISTTIRSDQARLIAQVVSGIGF